MKLEIKLNELESMNTDEDKTTEFVQKHLIQPTEFDKILNEEIGKSIYNDDIVGFYTEMYNDKGYYLDDYDCVMGCDYNKQMCEIDLKKMGSYFLEQIYIDMGQNNLIPNQSYFWDDLNDFISSDTVKDRLLKINQPQLELEF